jgi:hypothetical protein
VVPEQGQHLLILLPEKDVRCDLGVELAGEVIDLPDLPPRSWRNGIGCLTQMSPIVVMVMPSGRTGGLTVRLEIDDALASRPVRSRIRHHEAVVGCARIDQLCAKYETSPECGILNPMPP